ncbi:uncharacterized protein F54H12.2-like [Panonychus citri]|uniref:uncharacterized protein F54H12.2-like n=1 Tax=Panonychus citri TaxID=50023 RepID=UPI0023082ADC|nr:uncharacterized protein F54H12.2-like [Panonychus citri]XP_053207950.1 uncharacterized protein F54H12.2-like [Panonychus citri]XP_053208482.1 uncharacterized protein F54H12.2-like [Panonychus citri]XP_053214653.1 uncharacterized protein F54H12.2-like [Panonychus citri]
MEYLHAASVPSTKSELSLFSVPPTQVAIESSYEVEYNPSASLESSQYHEIYIPASDDFTDLSSTMIHLKVQILEEGKPTKKIFQTVPDFGHAIFEQIDFILNNVNTVKSSNMYHYQAYLENLLFKYPSNIDIGSEGTNGSDEKEMYFNLHVPICQQDRLLINGVPIQICFTRSKNGFPIVVGDKTPLTVKITKLSVHIKRIKLFPDAQAGVLTTLEKIPAKYFIVRNELKAFALNPGSKDYSFENVHNGIFPRRMIIGIVNSKAFSGEIELNPFKFEHYKCNHISLNVDGVMIPSIPYKPDFIAKTAVREYIDLFKALDQSEGIPQIDIKYSEFCERKTLFGFDLTNDGSIGGESGTLNLLRRGSIRLELRFAETFTDQLKIIVFSQFDNVITIDRDRNVTLDY